MSRLIHQKITHKLAVPIVFLIGLTLLNLDFYWYVAFVALSCAYILLSRRLIVVDAATVDFTAKFNPFVKERRIETKLIQRVISVDRSSAIRGSFPHSYLRIFANGNQQSTYRIALSDKSVTELFRAFNQLNTQTESTTDDLDKDRLR